MTFDRFVFGVGLLLYLVLFGIRYEENKLVEFFGNDYVKYVACIRGSAQLCERSMITTIATGTNTAWAACVQCCDLRLLFLRLSHLALEIRRVLEPARREVINGAVAVLLWELAALVKRVAGHGRRVRVFAR